MFESGEKVTKTESTNTSVIKDEFGKKLCDGFLYYTRLTNTDIYKYFESISFDLVDAIIYDVVKKSGIV